MLSTLWWSYVLGFKSSAEQSYFVPVAPGRFPSAQDQHQLFFQDTIQMLPPVRSTSQLPKWTSCFSAPLMELQYSIFTLPSSGFWHWPRSPYWPANMCVLILCILGIRNTQGSLQHLLVSMQALAPNYKFSKAVAPFFLWKLFNVKYSLLVFNLGK